MKKIFATHKILSLLLLILLSAAIVVSVVSCGDENALGSGEKAFSVEVTHGDGTVETFEVKTDKKTVSDALLEVELIQGEESQYGLTVITVDGESHDFNNGNTYWSFYINGEYAMTGVSSTDVEEGAVYAFKVESFG